MNELGPRLKSERLRSGLSLREVARRLGVSASFVSQMENGKSQPSVATLYQISQLLKISIDELFMEDSDHGPEPDREVTEAPEAGTQVSRAALGSPGDAWPVDEGASRFVLVQPGSRRRLTMDSGVIWEQLASSDDRDLDFIEIIYPPGSSSTNDGHMLRHAGVEYGYLLSGELEITYGFEKHMLRAGDSMALDSSVPHLLTNHGDVPARGIWAVHHCARR